MTEVLLNKKDLLEHNQYVLWYYKHALEELKNLSKPFFTGVIDEKHPSFNIFFTDEIKIPQYSQSLYHLKVPIGIKYNKTSNKTINILIAPFSYEQFCNFTQRYKTENDIFFVILLNDKDLQKWAKSDRVFILGVLPYIKEAEINLIYLLDVLLKTWFLAGPLFKVILNAIAISWFFPKELKDILQGIIIHLTKSFTKHKDFYILNEKAFKTLQERKKDSSNILFININESKQIKILINHRKALNAEKNINIFYKNYYTGWIPGKGFVDAPKGQDLHSKKLLNFLLGNHIDIAYTLNRHISIPQFHGHPISPEFILKRAGIPIYYLYIDYPLGNIDLHTYAHIAPLVYKKPTVMFATPKRKEEKSVYLFLLNGILSLKTGGYTIYSLPKEKKSTIVKTKQAPRRLTTATHARIFMFKKSPFYFFLSCWIISKIQSYFEELKYPYVITSFYFIRKLIENLLLPKLPLQLYLSNYFGNLLTSIEAVCKWYIIWECYTFWLENKDSFDFKLYGDKDWKIIAPKAYVDYIPVKDLFEEIKKSDLYLAPPLTSSYPNLHHNASDAILVCDTPIIIPRGLTLLQNVKKEPKAIKETTFETNKKLRYILTSFIQGKLDDTLKEAKDEWKKSLTKQLGNNDLLDQIKHLENKYDIKKDYENYTNLIIKDINFLIYGVYIDDPTILRNILEDITPLLRLHSLVTTHKSTNISSYQVNTTSKELSMFIESFKRWKESGYKDISNYIPYNVHTLIDIINHYLYQE